jgi:hypothetical protein
MQSMVDAVSRTVTHGVVMQSDVLRSSGFRPSAITRIAISRSVITPMGRIDSRLSTTGISPQSQRFIMRATSTSGVSGVQQAGSLVMSSRISMFSPQWISQMSNAVLTHGWDDTRLKKVTRLKRK